MTQEQNREQDQERVQAPAERLTRGFDVAVIGGGAAGLSGAVTLGRARRSVIVIDAGSPRNAPAEGVHGWLTRDGISPAELVETGRKEVDQYGGVLHHGEARSARRTPDGFEVVLADGTVVAARRLLVTTGLVDELPDIPGLRQRWGRDVIHCPYCHGWEVRDQPVGILGTGPWAVHQALLFRQWTSDLVLFTHTAPPLTDEQAEQLAARDIRVVTGPVDALDVVDDQLTGVVLADGTVVARRALVVLSRLVASSGVLATLGLQTTADPRGVGEFVAADPTGLTEVPGVWVAGNVTDLVAQVVTAASGGVLAGAAINADLIAEETERAVEAHRKRNAAEPEAAPTDAAPMHRHHHAHKQADEVVLFTQEFWDERYRSADRIWSGNANPHLVDVTTELSPATALDVGCGEGADVVWLASRGWQVTGVDISRVALDRAAAQATAAGSQIADRITLQQADLLSWGPEPLRYDLVSAQFIHLPRLELEALHRRLAAAVRPGGTLLIVGHHPSDLETTIGRPNLPELMFTAEQVAAVLDPQDWEIEATAPPRQVTDPEGRSITIRDAVLRAVRRR
ncbi:thioredoxin reductase [Micromonospora pisi]|uniref:Thioredoxin reductase n=2 Tax=Micromonospora pisi TaxID=589240 RepID=A0A495JAG5_9ACTN|nr:thioredoxin reductase [Micromonospora pisi]